MNDSGWDYDLEEKAARVASLVRERRLHEEAGEPVPLFLVRGNLVIPFPKEAILEIWVGDPDNADEDWEFIRELRRTDLPTSSFFVLVYPENAKRYHWHLSEPA